MKQKKSTECVSLAVRASLALVLLCLPAGVFAQDQYVLESGVFGNGLAAMENAEYSFHGTAGQPFVGTMTGGGEPSYGQIIGFWYVQHSVLTGISPMASLPLEFMLGQNYPNPFNPVTTIQYALPRRSDVTLTIFNTLGQHVATLVSAELDPGYYSVQFDASGLASGVYFYRLQAGSFVQTKKLLLVR